MAFNSNAARSNDRSNNTNNDQWKAQGFLNFYLPSENGGRAKLGAIALKDGTKNSAALLAWLEADEDNAAKLLSSLIVEFRSAEPAAGSGFKLPV